MIETYRASGRVGIGLLPLALVACVIAAGAGMVYQLLLAWIPSLYLAIFLPFGLGALLGYLTMTMVVGSGRCRNGGFALLVGLLIGTAGLAGGYYTSFTRLRDRLLGELPEQMKPMRAEIESQF